MSMPGRSKQDYGTPWKLIHAIEARWDALRVDLAASEKNAKCGEYITEEDDSLRCDWAVWIEDGLGFLNPPFEDIAPWAERCDKYSDHNIILLVPASVGSEWFAKYVEGKAKIVGLRPRIAYQGCHVINKNTGLPKCGGDDHCDGCQGYPKDCMLCLYGPMFEGMPVFSTWRWDQ